MSTGDTIGAALRAIQPNLDQGLSLSRAGLQGIGASLITTGLPTGNWVLVAIGAGIYIVTIAWGLFAHTDAAKLHAVVVMPPPAKAIAFRGLPDAVKLAAVEAMPDVARVVVRSSAINGLAAAAADPARPKIVKA